MSVHPRHQISKVLNIRTSASMESQVPPGFVSQVPSQVPPGSASQAPQGPEVAPGIAMPPPPPPPPLPSTSARADLYRDLVDFGIDPRTTQSRYPILRNNSQQAWSELPRVPAPRIPGMRNQAPRNRNSTHSIILVLPIVARTIVSSCCKFGYVSFCFQVFAAICFEVFFSIKNQIWLGFQALIGI